MYRQNNSRLPERIGAVIFDMDGLMLDTERLHLENFRKAAQDFGYETPEDVYMQSMGMNSRDTEKLFHRHFGDSFPYVKIRDRWREYADDHIGQFGVPHKPGLIDLLDLLRPLGFPKAVATSTRRENAIRLLEKVRIIEYFNAIVGGDEVSKGKPDPEIFLTAAERLRVEPATCVVFEDSPAGIRAAHAAGMTPILVPDLISPPPDVRVLAFRILESLEDAPDLFINPAQ
jgi:HAD superfamily hydrolase (TIGR01509 family)